MASLRTRVSGGRTVYQVRWRDGGRRDSKEAAESFHTKREAVKFRGLVDAAGQRWPEGWVPGHGFITTGPSLTLAEWFPRALAARGSASEATKASYQRDYELHVPDWLSSKPLAEIRREDVGLWIRELQTKGLSVRSIRKQNNTVSSVVRQAILDGHIDRNPFVAQTRHLAAYDDESTEMVCLAPHEFSLLQKSIYPRYRDFVTFAYGTGLRWSEITALAPSQVDLEKATLHVTRAWKKAQKRADQRIGPPKTARGRRIIGLTEAQVEILRARMGGALVFQNAEGGRILQDTFYKAVWKPAVDKSGLSPAPRFHDLRHSHASQLLEKGVPILRVSRRLGHASIKVTADVYGHLLPESEDLVRQVLTDLDL